MQLKKEIVIYLFLLLILSLSMHFGAWTSHPMAHLEALKGSSLGPWHPFLITAAVYMVVLIIRLLIGVVKRVVR